MNDQKQPMTTAERQARRSLKLKAGLSEAIQLRADVKTAVFMLKSTISTMRKIALDSDINGRLAVAIDQAETAIRFLDELPSTHNKRFDD